jgi:hypothetical protein
MPPTIATCLPEAPERASPTTAAKPRIVTKIAVMSVISMVCPYRITSWTMRKATIPSATTTIVTCLPESLPDAPDRASSATNAKPRIVTKIAVMTVTSMTLPI